MISYRIDKDNADTPYIKNWVEQLNMQCMPKAYIGLVGAMAFGGVFISCFFIPALGDKYGRHMCWAVTLFF